MFMLHSKLQSEEDIAFASATELHHLMVKGDLSATELTDIYLKRIKKYNCVSKAYIAITANEARITATSFIRHDLEKSPFAGVPFAAKDLFDVEGIKTTGGSRVFHDHLAEKDAVSIARLKAGKAISLGKLNLHEFAYGATGENPEFGTCPNVYDTTRLAGGSSSGSAAALAFGLAPATLGTDTGGSVRAPASLNGIVGLKPTMGRVSTRGVMPYCWTLDHVGLMTRTVHDCANLLGLIAGFDPQDPVTVNVPVDDYAFELDNEIAGLRVGIPANFFYERTDPEILAAVERVQRYLVSHGAQLVPVTMPDMTNTRTVSLTVQMPEALSVHSRYLEERGDLYGQDFRAGLALGQCLLAEHYVRAKRFIEVYRQQTNALFDDVDILLTPTTPAIAPHIGTVTTKVDGMDEPVGNAITRFTSFFNMTGHPAITVPCGLHSEGLPMGVQIVGRYFDEKLILNVARLIEKNDEFSVPRPKIG
ncbi:amidase [Pseudovibrio sp. FO-BEG1]|uniref:amidase n=1 Tax=Pseudovibrio sp. (strain FO-BEG1) TaxID=911045 RepID=UPI0003138C0A|nr:amidase [Pseudovibrio sp. FO-BEG1]